jgi:micrococcal nuclease
MTHKKQGQLTRSLLTTLGIPAIFVPGLILAGLLGWDYRAGLARFAKNPNKYLHSTTVYPERGYVTQVLDGDTIKLKSGETVRYNGIDSPELNHLWAKEAKTKNSSLVLNKNIVIEYDTERVDSYGRLLAYVWVDGQFVNAILIEEGLAKYARISKAKELKYNLLFQNKERWAKERHNGIWYRSY